MKCPCVLLNAEGVMETMDGEILQIAIRKYFR